MDGLKARLRKSSPLLVGLSILLLAVGIACVYRFSREALPVFSVTGRLIEGEASFVAAAQAAATNETVQTKVKVAAQSDTIQAKAPTNVAQFQWEEYAARMMWTASNFLTDLALVVLLVNCVWVLYKEGFPKGFVATAVVVGGALFGIMYLLTRAGTDMKIATVMQDEAQRIAQLSSNVKIIDTVENFAVLIVAVLFAAANGALIVGSSEVATVDELRRKQNDAQELLNLGAFFLVLGVFHLWTQMNWPIVFLKSAEDREYAKMFSNAVTFAAGSIFTALLGGVYFTTLFNLRLETPRLMTNHLKSESETGATPTDEQLQKALKRSGLYASLLFDITSLLKVLSPLIAAGPVSGVLQFVYGT